MSDSVPFLKMHGAGNDFVIIDRRERFVPITPEAVRVISDRHCGVGFDQLITIDTDPDVAARITFWNSDGSESGACGNGTRCVAALLMHWLGKEALTLKTERGLLVCRRINDFTVSVDMLAPRFAWQDIPLKERMDTRGVDIKLGPADAPTLSPPGCVNMGNPHCVFFVEDINRVKVEIDGPFVERHFMFPEFANVGFAQVHDRDHIRLRVWERGAGLTLACGSGACAAVVAGIRKNLLDRVVHVDVDGGTLQVEWVEETDHVILTGPVHLSFEGELPAELFEMREAAQ